MSIIREERKTDNLYVIDTFQFNLPTLTSIFCWYDGEKGILMDAGTSDNTDAILASLDKYGIPAERIAGVVPSHYHFDHGGGCAELWKRMRGINPDFTIYTTPMTKHKLNNAASHLRGAATTFGKFAGTMESLPEVAFTLLEPGSYLPVEFNDGSRIMLLHTPGHTPDHCSPAVMRDERCVFCYAAEACGTLYTGREVLTTPSSMPPNFHFSDYMESIEKVRMLKPELIGFCHFGILSGRDIENLFEDHTSLMTALRGAISDAFREEGTTEHVMKATASLWEGRIDKGLLTMKGSELFFGGLRLALTYGLMVDLGLREPKYEEPFSQQ
ncbi:MAG TPA: MBL fold metallo-hydrolase [Spirochaetota bacterium]|nr:MBL fold metallo-hydrolase [Spirochaetota bacterium]HPJ35686.1 MBL fold metallo-hydrolase [Spirochaetota bacterium]